MMSPDVHHMHPYNWQNFWTINRLLSVARKMSVQKLKLEGHEPKLVFNLPPVNDAAGKDWFNSMDTSNQHPVKIRKAERRFESGPGLDQESCSISGLIRWSWWQIKYGMWAGWFISENRCLREVTGCVGCVCVCCCRLRHLVLGGVGRYCIGGKTDILLLIPAPSTWSCLGMISLLMDLSISTRCGCVYCVLSFILCVIRSLLIMKKKEKHFFVQALG